MAPRLVRIYDAVAATAQTAFDDEATKVAFGNIADHWRQETKLRAWQYQLRSTALKMAKTRAECVKNATAVAVENAIRCEMPWSDAPATERDLKLPTPSKVGLQALWYAMPLSMSERASNSTDVDARKRYQWLLQQLEPYLQHTSDDLWSGANKCGMVQFF